jgi:hypothetical protein
VRWWLSRGDAEVELALELDDSSAHPLSVSLGVQRAGGDWMEIPIGTVVGPGKSWFSREIPGDEWHRYRVTLGEK